LCYALSNPEHTSTRFFIKFRKTRGVMGRNDQHMAWINGLNVHKDPAQGILENDT